MPAINLEKYVKEMKHLPVSVIFIEAMQTIGEFDPPEMMCGATCKPQQKEEEPIEVTTELGE
jgi:hypothetical protein